MKGKREANNPNRDPRIERLRGRAEAALDRLREWGKTAFGRVQERVDDAFDRHGDEAWEQIRALFAHPKRLILGMLAVLVLTGLLVGGSYLSKIRAPELPNKDSDTPPADQTDEELDYGDGVRPRVSGERKSKDFYTVLVLGRDTAGGGNTDNMLP